MMVKLCGIRRPEDVAYLNEFRPDYAGFVFAGSRRRVSPETAKSLAEKLDAGIRKAGVFVDEPVESIARTVRTGGLDAVQLHGNESAEVIRSLRMLLPDVEIWKAVRVRDRFSIPRALELGADRLLLDSFSESLYGGTGRKADWRLIKESNLRVPFILAGGLNSENMEEAVGELSPWGVDISSGIETNGVKDRGKIEKIMRMIRKVGK